VALVDLTQSKVAVDVERAVIDNIPKGRSFQSLITFRAWAREWSPCRGGRNDKNNSFSGRRRLGRRETSTWWTVST